MCLQSMTGYGSGLTEKYRVEIRSSNHKNLDIQVNIPPYLFPYELLIKKMVRKKFSRGRIDVYIPKIESEEIKVSVNKTLAKKYFDAMTDLKESLSLVDDVTLSVLVSQKDILNADEPDIDDKELYNTVSLALEELERSRSDEGRDMIDDIHQRSQTLKNLLGDIEKKRMQFMPAAIVRLQEKIKELLGNSEIDETRILQEVAILVERSDITEEIVRIKSHIGNFEGILKSEDIIGKKLDFVVQELRREINTIGAKAQDAEIAHCVVEMKHEVERIREQLQNLQ